MSGRFYIAQLNIGRSHHPVDHPRMIGFTGRLAEINALAERTPGYVWRLQDEAGNATGIKAFDDPLIIVNLSVWEIDRAALRVHVSHRPHRGLPFAPGLVRALARPASRAVVDPCRNNANARRGARPTRAAGRERPEPRGVHAQGPIPAAARRCRTRERGRLGAGCGGSLRVSREEQSLQKRRAIGEGLRDRHVVLGLVGLQLGALAGGPLELEARHRGDEEILLPELEEAPERARLCRYARSGRTAASLGDSRSDLPRSPRTAGTSRPIAERRRPAHKRPAGDPRSRARSRASHRSRARPRRFARRRRPDGPRPDRDIGGGGSPRRRPARRRGRSPQGRRPTGRSAAAGSPQPGGGGPTPRLRRRTPSGCRSAPRCRTSGRTAGRAEASARPRSRARRGTPRSGRRTGASIRMSRTRTPSRSSAPTISNVGGSAGSSGKRGRSRRLLADGNGRPGDPGAGTTRRRTAGTTAGPRTAPARAGTAGERARAARSPASQPPTAVPSPVMSATPVPQQPIA